MVAPREDIQPTLGRWANRLTVIVAGFLPLGYALIALVLSIGGPSQTKDTWIGRGGGIVLLGGAALAAAAFVLAGASRIRREPIDLLWLPLVLLPVLATVAVLIGVFVFK
jgi:hypothetical protein